MPQFGPSLAFVNYAPRVVNYAIQTTNAFIVYQGLAYASVDYIDTYAYNHSLKMFMMLGQGKELFIRMGSACRYETS